MAAKDWTSSATIRFADTALQRGLSTEQMVAYFNRVVKVAHEGSMSKVISVADVDRVNTQDRETLQENAVRIRKLQAHYQTIQAFQSQFKDIFPHGSPHLLEDTNELLADVGTEIETLAEQQRTLQGASPLDQAL